MNNHNSFASECQKLTDDLKWIRAVVYARCVALTVIAAGLLLLGITYRKPHKETR